MKRIIRTISFFMMLLIIGILSYKVFGWYKHYKEEMRIDEYADEFFYVHKVDGKIVFSEYELKVQILYFNLEYNKKYQLEELESAYLERNNLFYDYMNTFFIGKYAPDELISALDYITKKEWGWWFMHVTSQEQDEAVKMYIKEQQLCTDYFGDNRIKLYNLCYEQQIEFYNLYKDASYVVNDDIMKIDEDFKGIEQHAEHLVISNIEGDVITLVNEDDETVIYEGTCQNLNELKVGEYVYVEFYSYSLYISSSENGSKYKYYDIQFEKIEKENLVKDMN